jgi:hypothetical protein
MANGQEVEVALIREVPDGRRGRIDNLQVAMYEVRF